jgi:hypothetical protein
LGDLAGSLVLGGADEGVWRSGVEIP